MLAVPKGVTKKRLHPMETEKVLPALRNRRRSCRWCAPTSTSKRQRDAMDFGDQMALAARLATRFRASG
jgi:DNA helicase-2/ATP-dependent DNA helicase PcrA